MNREIELNNDSCIIQTKYTDQYVYQQIRGKNYVDYLFIDSVPDNILHNHSYPEDAIEKIIKIMEENRIKTLDIKLF